MTSRSIGDYALISDCHSAGLVSRDGSIDWLCAPRFDAPAVFARLLGDPAGHWSLRPVAAHQVTRDYVPNTLVHTSTFRTATGEAVVEDAMALGGTGQWHELGIDATHTLLRSVTGLSGEVEFDLEFLPRPEYGLVHPLLRPITGGLVAQGGADVFTLSAPVALSIDVSGHGHTLDTARARFRVKAGTEVCFALQYAMPGAGPKIWTQHQIRRGLHRTTRAWQAWAEMHDRYRGPWHDLVQRSGLVLRGLTYEPSGAVVAAPTTSLPEFRGGTRNWDYRYCWIRDAAFAMAAMRASACRVEAGQFLSYLVNTSAGGLNNGFGPQALFGVRGEHDLTERVLDHLDGWAGSHPVRVGNDAWRQIQLDVSGEILDAAAQMLDSTPLDPEITEFLVHLADVAANRWREPDHGIWERRDRRQHFVHSKLMCWVALDRAIALADRLGATHRIPEWAATKKRISEAIEAHGWSPRAQAYVQAFGSDQLDAATLMMPIVGYTSANSPRMRATIEAIRRDLTDERGLVYRYRTADDGIPGEEGTFVLCTFWLAHCLALAGEVDQARTVFRTATACTNDLDLLAEQVDAVDGQPLGNFPQAYSHIGLVNAAMALAEAESATTTHIIPDPTRHPHEATTETFLGTADGSE
jgi:GH15 family glucan-1,4-alpha-glucosidase